MENAFWNRVYEYLSNSIQKLNGLMLAVGARICQCQPTPLEGARRFYVEYLRTLVLSCLGFIAAVVLIYPNEESQLVRAEAMKKQAELKAKSVERFSEASYIYTRTMYGAYAHGATYEERKKYEDDGFDEYQIALHQLELYFDIDTRMARLTNAFARLKYLLDGTEDVTKVLHYGRRTWCNVEQAVETVTRRSNWPDDCGQEVDKMIEDYCKQKSEWKRSAYQALAHRVKKSSQGTKDTQTILDKVKHKVGQLEEKFLALEKVKLDRRQVKKGIVYNVDQPIEVREAWIAVKNINGRLHDRYIWRAARKGVIALQEDGLPTEGLVSLKKFREEVGESDKCLSATTSLARAPTSEYLDIQQAKNKIEEVLEALMPDRVKKLKADRRRACEWITPECLDAAVQVVERQAVNEIDENWGGYWRRQRSDLKDSHFAVSSAALKTLDRGTMSYWSFLVPCGILFVLAIGSLALLRFMATQPIAATPPPRRIRHRPSASRSFR